jgi:hypothetical protein
VRFLLEHGADRTKRSARLGRLPVDMAVACKHVEVAKILAEEPTSPVLRAADRQVSLIVEALLNRL